MFGELPPTSNESFLRLGAAVAMVALPVADSPVKVMASTSGWATSASPASAGPLMLRIARPIRYGRKRRPPSPPARSAPSRSVPRATPEIRWGGPCHVRPASAPTRPVPSPGVPTPRLRSCSHHLAVLLEYATHQPQIKAIQRHGITYHERAGAAVVCYHVGQRERVAREAGIEDVECRRYSRGSGWNIVKSHRSLEMP